MPSPKLVSIREFRSDMTQLLKDAQERDITYIIMRHSEPVARIVPFDVGTTLAEVMPKGAVEAKQVAKKQPKKAKATAHKSPKKKSIFGGWL